MFQKRSSAIIFIAIFFLFFLISLIVVSQQPQNISWDSAVHLHTSFSYVDFLKQKSYSDFFSKYFYYPPFLYWLNAILILSIGYTRLNIVIINFLFICIFFYCLYFFINRQNLTRQQKTLFLIFSLLNLVLSFKIAPPWELMLDLPQLCLTLGISCLIYAIILDKKAPLPRYESLAIGTLNSILLLTKWIGPIFVLIPNLFLLYKYIQKKNWLSIVLLIAPSLYFFYLWYIPNFQKFLQDALYQTFSVGLYEHDPQSFQSLLSYAQEYFEMYFVFLLSALGVILIQFFQHKSFKIKLSLKDFLSLPLLQLIVPTLLLVFVISNQDQRYMLPVFFEINLIISFYVCKILLDIKRNHFTFIFIALTLIQFILILPKYPRERAFTDITIQTALNNKMDTVYYFFENDSVYFNYANTELAHKENNYKFPGEYLTFKQLNNTDLNLTQKKGCAFSESEINDKTLIVDFFDPNSTGDHVKFEEECSSLLPKIKKINEIESTQGKISFYTVKKL